MSVLVEAISILIPRHALDEKFPGGAEGYLRLARRAPGARWALSDEQVTCVSFESLDEGQRFVEPLRQSGFDGTSDPIAFVDQYFGPTAVCRWLRWRRNDEGFTSCWLEGADAGELVAPPDWSLRPRGAAAGTAIEPPPATAPAAPEPAGDFSFDAGLLPDEFEEIDVGAIPAAVLDQLPGDPDDAAADDHAADDLRESRILGEIAPSASLALALDEVPPPLPSSGWDPTEPVRDDASDLAEDLPPAAGDGLFEPLQLGAALDSALGASPSPDEAPAGTEVGAAISDLAATAGGDGESDVEPPAVALESAAVAEPILTFRPPVGDGWDEEEELASSAQVGEEPRVVAETPAWGSAPQLATEEEDWWEGDAADEPPSRPAPASPPSQAEIAARVAAYEAQFSGESPDEFGEDEEPVDDQSAVEEPVRNRQPATAEDASTGAEAEEEAPLHYGAWLPDFPSAGGGSQPTPSSGTALLAAEAEEPEDYCGYHESYASVADGIVPAFAVPDAVIDRDAAAGGSSASATSDLATSALDLARSVLQRKGWLLGVDYEGTLLFQVRGSRARFQGGVSLEAGVETLRICTHLPTSVPPTSHAAVAEFLLRAAPRLALGAFELDYESGEMRCRVSVDLGDAPLTEPRLERLLGEGITACDRYHDAVMQLVYAGRSVSEALTSLD